MKKIILFLTLLFCICGCQSNLKDKEQLALDSVYETIYGHEVKNTKEAMTVYEAKAIVADFNSMYDKIEYYGIVKYAPVYVENEYHAFLAKNDKDNVYILLDIYNSVLTFATAEQLGIKN